MRWATSGRLTPAAATLIRICPAPGFGTGTALGFSTSGPPGVLISMAVIVSGTLAMASLSVSMSLVAGDTCPAPRVETRAKSCQGLRAGCAAEQETAMDWDDLKPKPKKSVTLGEDLTNSLRRRARGAHRRAASEEIERVKAELGAKKAHEAAAAQIFKR